VPRYEISDWSSIGKFTNARIRDFEEHFAPASVFVTDQKGFWEVRITYGERTRGTAYVSAPDSGGRVARIRRPAGDIEILNFTRSQMFEGFILEALESESQNPA
jgi:hypothetical protein